MDYKVKRLNECLKQYDRDVYAKREYSGVINIYRNGKTWFSYDLDGQTLLYSVPSPHFIFSLTDNWKKNGEPIDAGIEVVLAKLKASDLWQREDLVEELISKYENQKQSDNRDRKNNIEAFLYDHHSQFKKAFNEINTSTLAK